jgi:hypothetical protein
LRKPDTTGKGRLLAADVGSGAHGHHDVEAEALDAADVLAQKPFGPPALDHLVEVGLQIGVLGPEVDEAQRSADGSGPYGHTLHDQVGVLTEDEPVFEGAGLAFVGVAHDVLGSPLLGGGEVPLDAGGEAGAAASLQLGVADGVDYLAPGNGQRLLQAVPRRYLLEAELVAGAFHGDVGVHEAPPAVCAAVRPCCRLR